MRVLAGTELSYTGPFIVVGAILTIVAVVAAAVAVGRSSLVQSQLAGLREDRDDQAKRIDRLEEENTRITQAWQTEKNARQVLERLVTGREQLDNIIDLLKQHEVSTATANEAMIEAIRALGRAS